MTAFIGNTPNCFILLRFLFYFELVFDLGEQYGKEVITYLWLFIYHGR